MQKTSATVITNLMKDRFDASRTTDGRNRLLIDAITDYAIYTISPAGAVTNWNAGAQKLYGYTTAEIVGALFSRFDSADDYVAGLASQALTTAKEQERFEFEGWRVRKDGQRFWAHVILDPVWHPDGSLEGFVAVTRDLSEQHAQSEKLLDSEQQFRLLVEGVTDYALYMLSPDGYISSWNPGAERIKQYRAEEVLGEHFSKFYTEEDREAGLPALGLATATSEGRWEHEGWRVRKDGSRFRAHVVIDAMLDDARGLIGFAKVTRDITERYEAEKALEKANRALLQSQKMEAIGQLTGGVAHDFNNLLTAVLGSLELVVKHMKPDPRLSPLIDNAIQGAKRGASLTQRMLAFARKQDLALEPTKLKPLVEDVLAFADRSIGPMHGLEVRITTDVPAVVTDANQLENALLNLLVNARDAMPNGGTIRIDAREERIGSADPVLKPGPYVCLGVTDSGDGMDAETLRRATEPFFTTKGVGKGTGLGLSMVHGLALQSGGDLRLKSVQGHGSTIEIWLPAARTTPVAAESNPSVTHAIGDGPSARTYTILAVDDDPLVLLNTVAMLEDMGHRVVEAQSGAEALQKFNDHPDIDLIVTDQAMPKMSGIEMVKSVREKRPDIPIIVATGYAELPSVAPNDLRVLNKPFSQAQLQTAIDALSVLKG